MYLLLRHHRCWIFTVLLIAVSHVDRGQCQGGFFKTYFQKGKAGFVNTDEKTYHAEYEFDLDDVLQQTERFFKRFTDTVSIAVTVLPHENKEEIQETTIVPEDDCDSEEGDCSEDQTEKHLSTTEGTTEPLVGENQTPAVEGQPPATEKATVDEKPISKQKFFQKKKKKKFQTPFISLLDNFKLFLNVPIKLCKYERTRCLEKRAEHKVQCPSEDYCDPVT